MSVHKKLMEARIRLQNTKLNKSGMNKFAGYSYFELADFLPTVQQIFNDLGLCGTVSYGREYASLSIVDIEDNSCVIIESPMAGAELKGCHPIQNLGASQTYLRRYLWVTAMEIVEHDALEVTTGKETNGVHKPTSGVFVPDDEEAKFLMEIVDNVKWLGEAEQFAEAAEFLASKNLDSDEKVWVWDKLDSKTRSGIKKSTTKEQK